MAVTKILVIVTEVEDEVNNRYVLCSLIVLSLFFCQVGVSNDYSGNMTMMEERFIHSDEPFYQTGIIGTPFSEIIDPFSNRIFIQYNIDRPSVLSYNFSLEGVSAISNVGFNIDFYESEKQYIPQLDDYSLGSHRFYITSTLLTTGLTLGDDGLVYASEQGFLIFDFIPTWGDNSNLVRLNLTVHEHHVFEDDATEYASDNSLSWLSDETWESLRFTAQDDGLFNISVSSHFDYATPGDWPGGTVSALHGYLIDLQHGKTGSWNTYSIGFYLDPGANVGIESWFDYEVLSLPQGEYYLILGSRQFEHLGELNLTLNVDRINTVSMSPNEEREIGVITDNPFILEVSPEYYQLNDLYFEITNGANWSVKAMRYYDTHSMFSAEYYQDTSTNYVNTLGFHDFIIMEQTFGLEASYPSPALSGDLFRDEVRAYGQHIMITNYTDISPAIATPMKNHFPKFYFTVLVEPLDSVHSETFNATIKFDAEEIPDIMEGANTLDFNMTSGPTSYFYKIPVESGTIIDATIAPMDYGVFGAAFLTIFPDVQTKKNWQITNEPYLAWSDPVGSVPYNVLGYNDNAHLRVMSVTDGYMILNPYSYSSYPSDLTEAELYVVIVDPIEYQIGDSISKELTSDSLVSYEFNVIKDRQYEIEMELSGIEANAIFFNEDGHSPFYMDDFNPWINLDPISSLIQSVVYTTKESNTSILAFAGVGTVNFTINEIEVASNHTTIYINNTVYVNNTIYLGYNTTEYNQAYTDGRNFGLIIAGAGVAGLMILIIILRRR